MKAATTAGVRHQAGSAPYSSCRRSQPSQILPRSIHRQRLGTCLEHRQAFGGRERPRLAEESFSLPPNPDLALRKLIGMDAEPEDGARTPAAPTRLLLCCAPATPEPHFARQDTPAPRAASQTELHALLAAAAAGRLCRLRASLQPHFSQADLMAALSRALLLGDVPAAALLLRHTRRLPVLQAGQSGSLPDLDGVSAATLRRFVADGGLAAAGGWGGWGGDHLYSALELGMEQTAAALLAGGARLPGTPEGGSCLHALAESTHAWGRPELAVIACRLVALGQPLTALDAQQRTPLLVACQHRLCRTQGRPRSRDGLDLLLALSSPSSTALGAPMQLVAAQGDYQGVARMARGGGEDVAAMSVVLPLAAAALQGGEVAALRLCGAAVPPGAPQAGVAGTAGMAGAAEEHPLLRGALSLNAAALLLRFGLTFRRAALLRILGRNALVTAPALAAAAPAAATPEALAAARQAGGRQAGDEAQLAAWRVAAVLAHEVRPFLLCMHRLERAGPGSAAGGDIEPSKRRRRAAAARPVLPSLPGSAVDLICVFLMLQHHFWD
ncbi:hypothetical protein ABPG75_005215 [Micractinium tetrahymenae]